MKRWIWIPVLVLAVLLFACQKEEEAVAPIAQGVSQTLDTAVEKLSQGQVGAGIQDLLDTILVTNPKGYISEDFEKKVREARAAVQVGDMEVTFRLLAESRSLFLQSESRVQEEESALETQEGKSESGPAAIAEAVKELLNRAKLEFQEGRAKEGVKSILDALSLFNPI